MIVTPDGTEFTTFLEGVRVSATSISISYRQMEASATISIYPHESAKKIKDGSILTIFFKKAGLKGRKLLYFGYLVSRGYRKKNGIHSMHLSFSARVNFLNKIKVAAKGDTAYGNVQTQAFSVDAAT